MLKFPIYCMSYQLVYDIVKIALNTFIVTLVCYYFLKIKLIVTLPF